MLFGMFVISRCIDRCAHFVLRREGHPYCSLSPTSSIEPPDVLMSIQYPCTCIHHITGRPQWLLSVASLLYTSSCTDKTVHVVLFSTLLNGMSSIQDSLDSIMHHVATHLIPRPNSNLLSVLPNRQRQSSPTRRTPDYPSLLAVPLLPPRRPTRHMQSRLPLHLLP